jgi:hypothetical protein
MNGAVYCKVLLPRIYSYDYVSQKHYSNTAFMLCFDDRNISDRKTPQLSLRRSEATYFKVLYAGKSRAGEIYPFPVRDCGPG